MAPSSSVNKTCVLPLDGGSYPITGPAQERDCLQKEGQVVPQGGGGGQLPMSSILLRQSLPTPLWQDVPDVGNWTNADSAERLVLFPLCAVKRRVPSTSLFETLVFVNEGWPEELESVVDGDETLRGEMVELLLEMSTAAAAALELSDSGEETVFTLSEDFLVRARRVAETLQAQSSNDGFNDALNRLLSHAERLRDVPLSEVLTILREG